MARNRRAKHRTGTLKVAACLAAAGWAAAWVAGAPMGPPGGIEIERSDGSLIVDNAIYYHLRASDLLDEDAVAPEHVLRRFMERHTASDYMGAAEAAQELVQMAGDRPIAHYNLACAMARLGRTDRAIESLNDAIACGWRNIGHTERDWDLASIRKDPRYQDAIRRMRDLLEREQPPSGPLRTDPIEEVVTDLERESPKLLERYHVPAAAIAVIRNGTVAWTGSFQVASDGDESNGMTEQMVFRSGAPARLSAALSASDRMARGDLSLAQLMIDHQNGEVVARGADQTARTVGISEQGALVGLRTDQRTARTAALSGEARLPTAHGWPVTFVRPSSFELYCIAVESHAAEPSFRDFCEARVFEPFGLTRTSFHLQDSMTEELVTGHTLLGTPLKPKSEAQPNDLFCYTSVNDLGRMVESLMADTGFPVGLYTAGFANTVRQLGKIVPGAGLGIDVQQTEDGLRIQLAEEHHGTGCLIRWYPETGDGVVIAFNAEAGPSAALRLAGIALGGHH